MTETLDHLRTPVLLLGTLAVGLQAGTYFTWATGVMPGLARTDDRTFVHAVQQMNIAIVNPVFLATFLGAPVLSAAAVALTTGDARRWAIAALVLSVATVVVTGAANIPLNDAMEAAGNVDRIGDLAGVRAAFEDSWVRWNIVRVLTSAGALVAVGGAALASVTSPGG
ncbi:DUF1772 domain-containing protein [soil metagenome]